MYSRIGAAAYKNDLTNTLALCEFLGNPHKKIKTIHIAGTNGKGSTSHMLAAILQKSGYKTGLYTSPHLVDFRERIRINGEMIDSDFVIDFVERTKAITQTIQPSFFELTVAMAFDFFYKSEVEVAIIETGLGGRLDSTNVITPELSIITNIGFDHMNLLGNTLSEIAFEKAGIIKQNVPVIIGAYLAETRPVFIEKAVQMQSPVIFAEDDFITEIISSDNFLLKCRVNDCVNHQSFEYAIDLPGLYQQKNLNTVFASVQQLKKIGYEISHHNMQAALLSVKSLTGLGGRWECIGVNPTIILEVALNEDGIRNVMQQIQHAARKSAEMNFQSQIIAKKTIDFYKKIIEVN